MKKKDLKERVKELEELVEMLASLSGVCVAFALYKPCKDCTCFQLGEYDG